MKYLALLPSLLALSSPASAFWRLPCGQTLTISRADPIIQGPTGGGHSHHAHNVFGGSAFNLVNTFDEIRNSKCTTCMVKQDKSVYWIPQLYHKNANGTFTTVYSQGALIYYLQRGEPSDGPIQAFPDGFRMIAGDMSLRTYSDTLEQRAITYACIGVSGPQTHEWPKQYCPGGLRAQVNFPMCWDGKNIDSPNHKSHVAYASLIDNGNCPKTHPVRLMHLFYEVVFDMSPYQNEYANGRTPDLVWAMGDYTGYGLHADFMNGWDKNVLQAAIDQCTSPSGVIEECKPFQLYVGTEMRDCKLDRSLGLNEVVTGTIPQLLIGGNKVAKRGLERRGRH